MHTFKFSIFRYPAIDDSFAANQVGFLFISQKPVQIRKQNPVRMFQGLAYRRRLFQLSKSADFMGRLFLPAFTTTSLIPGNCNWELHLTLCKNSFLLVQSSLDNNKYIIQLEKADLHLNRVRLSEAGQRTVEAQMRSATLSAHTLDIDFLDYQITSISIASGQQV